MDNNNEQEFYIIPKFKEEELFSAPEGFFDNLPEKALKVAKANDAKRAIVRKKRFYYISSAAAVALVIMLMVFYLPTGNDAETIALNDTKDIQTNVPVSQPKQSDNYKPTTTAEEPLTISSQETAVTPARPAKTTSSVISEKDDIAEPAETTHDTDTQYGCPDDFDDMCYIDYQYLEYYSDELEEIEYDALEDIEYEDLK